MDIWDERLPIMNRRCGKKTVVRISESDANLNKPYYICRDKKVWKLARWCETLSPIISATTTLTRESHSIEERGRCLNHFTNQILLLEEMREEMVKQNEDYIFPRCKLERIEMMVGHIKRLVGFLIIVILIVGLKWG